MNSPAVTPEQLAVAARALGGDGFDHLDDCWWLVTWSGSSGLDAKSKRIGSDADLFDKLLDTMRWPDLDGMRTNGQWRCSCRPDPDGGLVDGYGPTKLAAVIACIAAMGAKSHKIADHHPDRHLYDPSRWLP
jgi:hypothetical protein